MSNPGTEVNIAVGGRILSDTSRNVEDVLAEVVEEYYKPRDSQTRRKLVEIFQRAEEAYFGQWAEERFVNAFHKPMPGEFKLMGALFGTSPGPATFLAEPFLTDDGLVAYKKELKSILEDLPRIQDSFADDGRLLRITKSIIYTLTLINTIGYCRGQDKVWRD